ncbi:AAA family ATPase, partial [Candidatus Woesearchaeota archaeon]|nr:AAA family ATPase [Candidatus Woesearchaeota archaeon]
QQILDLLSLAKINPDGYNIILQGDIIHLVEMSPIERRGIIEEIAGIGMYEEKKQKALLELEKVEAKLNEAEIVLKERAAYLKELKKDRDQALKYKELNDRLAQNKASFLKRKIDVRAKVRDDFDAKIAKEQEKLHKIHTKIGALRDDVSKKKDEIAKLNQEMELKGGTEQIALQKHVEQLRIEIATAKTRINSCQNEINRIHQRKDQMRATLEDVQSKIARLEEDKKDKTEHLANLAKQKKDLETKLAELRKKHHLDDQAAGIEDHITKLERQIETRDKEVQALREKQQSLLREKDKIDYQIQTVDERIKKVQELEKAHQEEIQALKAKKEEFKKATLELNALLNKDSNIAVSVATTRKMLFDAREALSKLEVRNAAVQESIAGSIAVTKILKNKKDFGGVYGTVADLGEVKSKYALALETAAGPRIKSLVVKDDKVASECIMYLKENKLGTASFLPLNKIKGPEPDKKVQKLVSANGVQGLAIDLIEYESQFKNVFSYVFGNTLIVDDIQVARRLGIGEARMATLDGDLAELSGVMIGGFRQQKKGAGFKEKELTSDLRKVGEDVVDYEVKLQKYENEKKENEERINRLRELKANLEGDIIKAEKSLHLDSTDLDASLAFKTELKGQSKDLDKDLTKVTENITEQNRSLANLKIEKQKMRDAINQLKNPEVLAELNAFDQKRIEIQTKLIQIEADLHNIDIQIKDILKRDEENTKRILKEQDKEETQFDKEIERLIAQTRHFEKELAVQEEKLGTFHHASKQMYEKRNALQDAVNKFDGDVYKIEENGRQFEYGINALSLENAKVKAEMAGLEAEFEQYRNIELDMERSEEELRKEIEACEKMRDTIGNVNLRALEIYDTVEKEYSTMLEKKEILATEKTSVLDLMTEIEGRKKEVFMKNFETVNGHFQHIFTDLSHKGIASLELENPQDPLSEGMLIKVKLTGNKFMDIRSLSGGEKTITALAFLFAVQEHDPASFYVLDEVDAALDKNNAEKLAKLIRKYTDRAQYVVISHNDAVIAEADTLYGVSMNEHGISTVVGLRI